MTMVLFCSRRRFGGQLTALGLCAGLLLGCGQTPGRSQGRVPAPKAIAHALSLNEGTYEIVSVGSGKAITPAYDQVSDGVGLIQWDNTHRDIQRWAIHSLGDGTYNIENVKSGRAFDVQNSSLNNGALLVQFQFQNGENQKWKLNDLGDGTYQIQNVHSGKVLDVAGRSKDNGGSVIQYDYWGGDNQKWRLVPVSPPAPAPSGGVPSGYKLVFSDDFDRNTLDTSKWQVGWTWGRTAGVGNDGYYIGDSNVSVSGGALHLMAKRENVYGHAYTSGLVNSSPSLIGTYGYYEARIKSTDGVGLSSAFWLKNKSDAWPPEQDILESLGRDHFKAYQTLHWAGPDGSDRSDSSAYPTTFDATQDYHVYGYLWAPDKVCWYVDGVQTKCLTDHIPTLPTYIILNLGLPEWIGGPDGTTRFPASMDVDWVHVYQPR